ncbi:hypothetical protein Hanom_Chr14g01307301 [Helianthus anomalus]
MTQLSDLLISPVNIRLDDHISRYCQMVLSPPFDPFGLYAQHCLFKSKTPFLISNLCIIPPRVL